MPFLSYSLWLSHSRTTLRIIDSFVRIVYIDLQLFGKSYQKFISKNGSRALVLSDPNILIQKLENSQKFFIINKYELFTIGADLVTTTLWKYRMVVDEARIISQEGIWMSRPFYQDYFKKCHRPIPLRTLEYQLLLKDE